MTKFYNRGFGWICVECEKKTASGTDGRPRIMREGEAESRFATLSNAAMAKWADKERTILTCPACGATERIDR